MHLLHQVRCCSSHDLFVARLFRYMRRCNGRAIRHDYRCAVRSSNWLQSPQYLDCKVGMMKLQKNRCRISPAAAQVLGESRRTGLPAEPRDQNGILAVGRYYSNDVGLVTAHDLSIRVILSKPTVRRSCLPGLTRQLPSHGSRNAMFAESHGHDSLNRWPLARWHYQPARL